jgi:2'-5' RNA ligase
MVGEPWRLFVAIDLGSAARQELRRAQDAARGAGPLGALGRSGRGAPDSQISRRDRSRAGRPAWRGAPRGRGAARAIPLAHRELGAFPNGRRPRVIWLGLTGALDQLSALQRELDSALVALGIPAEVRPFRPHLTLGRVRDGAPPPAPETFAAAAAAVDATDAPVPVASVRLVRSELGLGGARYTTLCDAPLMGGGR